MSIKVDKVSKRYGRQLALDNISFELKKGEIVGFLGPNGAGKSTMMKIISCFVTPTSGRVEVCGNDIENESIKVRSLIGYLPESNPLYYDMYIKEYLKFVCGMYRVKKTKERIAEMIETTGLGVEQHKKIGQLSKGYKQRVGIAQALIHNPQVLILDEPTSGLDPNQLIGIRELIKELGKEKTVLFSSHIMQEVEAVSDRIIIIDRGKLITDQKVSDISASVNSAQVVVVEFEIEIEVKTLRFISTIASVEKVADNTYRFTGNSEIDIRKSISKWAQREGVLILALNKENKRLEDVFQKLTGKGGDEILKDEI